MNINTNLINRQQAITAKKTEGSKQEDTLLQNTHDQAVISSGEQPVEVLPQKDKCLIRRGIEKGAGFVGGLVGATLMAPAGALEGMVEGNESYKVADGAGVSTGPFTFTTIGGSMIAGALIGGATMGWNIMGGAVGAGAGLAFGTLARVIMGMADVPENFTESVDLAVDKSISDNPQGGTGAKKIANAVRNASEGTTMGLVAGTKAGYNIGERTAVGVTSGVLSVGTGIATGIGRIITEPFKGHKE
ncbi:MAG: hypothetical protein ABRQ38_03215 [Candidatus Eremiobacterota bacterium]